VLTAFRLNGLVRAEKPARDEASEGVKRPNGCQARSGLRATFTRLAGAGQPLPDSMRASHKSGTRRSFA
jgi:hypothetical protein